MKFQIGCGIITYLLFDSLIFAGDLPDKKPPVIEESAEWSLHTRLMMPLTNAAQNEEDPWCPPRLEKLWELEPNEDELRVILESAEVSDEDMHSLPLTDVLTELAKIKKQIKELKARLKSNPGDAEKTIWHAELSQLISTRDGVAKKNEPLVDQVDGALFERCRKYANQIAGLVDE